MGVGGSVGREQRNSKSSNQSVPPSKAAARSKIDVQDQEGEGAGGGQGQGGEEMCGKWREGVSVGTKVLDKSGVVRQVRLGVCNAPF